MEMWTQIYLSGNCQCIFKHQCHLTDFLLLVELYFSVLPEAGFADNQGQYVLIFNGYGIQTYVIDFWFTSNTLLEWCLLFFH